MWNTIISVNNKKIILKPLKPKNTSIYFLLYDFLKIIFSINNNNLKPGYNATG